MNPADVLRQELLELLGQQVLVRTRAGPSGSGDWAAVETEAVGTLERVDDLPGDRLGLVVAGPSDDEHRVVFDPATVESVAWIDWAFLENCGGVVDAVEPCAGGGTGAEAVNLHVL